jgi:threonine/homoserine/homoserine lactone efflux protein
VARIVRSSGSLGWGIGSAAGLTAITAASAQLYRAVQLTDAGYLLGLGLKAGGQPARQPRAR